MRPIPDRSAAAALAAVLALGCGLRVALLNVDDYMPKADEGVYLRYAAAVVRDGAALDALARDYLADPRQQRSPSPLRAGHILLSSAWMRLTGRCDFESLSRLSCLFSCLTLLLGWSFARRLFGPAAALATAALLAVSPLSLALGRRALQDAEVAFFLLAALYAFRETLRGRSSAPRLLLFAALFAAVVCKESSVLLLAFFAPWLAAERRREGAGAALAAILLSLAAAGAFTSWAVGGPAVLRRLVEVVVASQRTNPYVLKHQSGSILRYLGDFFLVSPWVLLLAAAALLAAVRGRLQPRAAVLFLAAFFAAEYAAYSGFARNLRYVLALDFPLRALAALWVCGRAAEGVRPASARAAARVLLVLVLAAGDLFVFRRVFLQGRIYDPVTSDLRDGWRSLLGLPED